MLLASCLPVLLLKFENQCLVSLFEEYKQLKTKLEMQTLFCLVVADSARVCQIQDKSTFITQPVELTVFLDWAELI